MSEETSSSSLADQSARKGSRLNFQLKKLIGIKKNVSQICNNVLTTKTMATPPIKELQSNSHVGQNDVEELKSALNGSAEILNDYCLLIIFSYLSPRQRIGIERVCKQWREVSLRSWSDVRKLDFEHDFKMRSFNKAHFENLLKRSGNYITELDIHRFYYIPTVETLTLISQYCHNLIHLNISRCKLKVNDNWKIISADVLRNLKSLHMDYAYLTDDILSSILKDAVNLEVLSIYNHCISGPGLMNLPEICTSLNIGLSCDTVCFEVSCFKEVFKKLRNLTMLNVDVIKVTYDELSSISDHLTSLSLCSVHDFFLKNYRLMSFSNLRTLNISLIDSVNDDVVLSLSRICPLLEDLDVSYNKYRIGPIGFQSLTKLTYLNSLKLNGTSITSESLEYIAAHSNGRFKRFQCRSCTELDDEGLSRVVELCPQLKSLDVSKGTPVTIKFFESILKSIDLRTNAVPLTIFFWMDEEFLYRNPYYHGPVDGPDIKKFASENISHPLLKVEFTAEDQCNETLRFCCRYC